MEQINAWKPNIDLKGRMAIYKRLAGRPHRVSSRCCRIPPCCAGYKP